jgi:anionic cell wall polymer biosynthesis LytR-Cps2A-Psr (LCP) family protein
MQHKSDYFHELSSLCRNAKPNNHGRNTSGNNGVLQIVKELLNISVNKVQIDVNKMGSLVQATGGITMQNPKTFNANGYSFKQGISICKLLNKSLYDTNR